MVAPEQPPTRPVLALPPFVRPSTIVLVFGGQIARADILRLCERVRVLLDGSDADLVVCDVGAVADPDTVTVDALARLQLTAKRLGRQVRLRNACDELQGLLALMGLSDVVPCALGVEPGGEAEEREEVLGVEEEADPGDLTV